MCLLHPVHFIYTDPLLFFFTCLIFKLFKGTSLLYSASYEQHQGIPLLASPSGASIPQCELWYQSFASLLSAGLGAGLLCSAVSASAALCSAQLCLGLPSGLQHLQGCCSPLEAKDMALIWSLGLSSHPSYKQLSPAVFAVLGVGINMSEHLIVAWPLLFMEMGQNKMRISLNLPPALV